MPGVQEESTLQVVRRTCAVLVQAHPSVLGFDDAACQAAAAVLPVAAVRAAAVRARLPIRFDSLQEELDYVSASSLLDFGSGFDPWLNEQGSTRRGAYEVIEFGMLGLAMQGACMDAAAMAGITKWEVASTFGIDTSEEKEVMPGVTMTSPGRLAAFAAQLTSTLNETGRILQQHGYVSLGAYVLAMVEGRRVAGRPPSAAALVEDLAESFPSFDDRQASEGGAVWHRKAQQLCCRLFLRFGREDERFAFADMDQVSMDSGEVAAAALCQTLGIVKLSPELAADVEACSDLAADERLSVLRAAVVEAGWRVCEAAGQEYSPWQLGMYLLRQARGEEEGWAALRRHVDRSTLAY